MLRLSAPIFRLKRQAKLLARETRIPHHKALDQVAQNEGFQSWSHLSASTSHSTPTQEILSQLVPGDLVLLGARPSHGKTLLALELAVEAAQTGRQGFFFTLEDNEEVVLTRIRSFGIAPENLGNSFTIDTSNDICADYVIEKVRKTPGSAFVVIDYLQLLDQKRSKPELSEQIRALKIFANSTGTIIITLSQIDRTFESQAKRLPELSDVRLPNPLDLTLFTKTCFLHEGEIQLSVL